MAFGNKINQLIDEKTTNNNEPLNTKTTTTTTTTKVIKKSLLSEDDQDEDDCGTCELLGVNDKKNQMFQMITNTTSTTTTSTNNNNNNNNNNDNNKNSNKNITDMYSEEDRKEFWESPLPLPPTTVELGNSGWTLLHTIAAYYPENPSEKKKKDVNDFLISFSKVYPCNVCAKDFREIIKETPPKLDSQQDFSLWLCQAHNNVNLQLGKPTFDCNLINKRWKLQSSSDLH